MQVDLKGQVALVTGAATGIGSADDINTNVNTLDAVNSTSGNIQVTEIAEQLQKVARARLELEVLDRRTRHLVGTW